MKNILVPTDFSDNADNALDYALDLARHTNRSVHLLHTYTVTTHAGHLANLARVVREDREKEMTAYLTKVKAKAGSVVVTARVREGDSAEQIKDEAPKYDANLIVMGTLGANNLAKKILGSTASNVIKHADLPVLAVPAGVKFQKFDHLVVALDALNMPATKVLDRMVDFAKVLSVEINLVHVSTPEKRTAVDSKTAQYLSSKGVKYTFDTTEAASVLKGIVDFASRYPKSVLCLISRQRNWFSNIFHSSISTGIAKETNLPLLVLHDGAWENK